MKRVLIGAGDAIRGWTRFAGALLSTIALLGAGVAMAATADDERAVLTAARHQIEAQHAARAEQCRRQFAVTPCLESAQAQRRESLAGIAARGAELDDAQRTQRAAERQARIAAKLARQDAAPTPLPLVPASTKAVRPLSAASAVEREPRPGPLLKMKADPSDSLRVGKPKPDVRAQAAEALRFEARQAQLRDRRATAEARRTQRERSGKTPSLPLPPAVGAASAAQAAR